MAGILNRIFGGQTDKKARSSNSGAPDKTPSRSSSSVDRSSNQPRVSLFEDDSFEVTSYGKHEVKNGRVVNNGGSMFASNAGSKSNKR